MEGNWCRSRQKKAAEKRKQQLQKKQAHSTGSNPFRCVSRIHPEYKLRAWRSSSGRCSC